MRFKLLHLFSTFHFGLLFIFLAVFLSLQFNIQKEFQQHILKSFFQQSHSALQAIFHREYQELTDMISSLKTNTLPNVDDVHVDLLFTSKDSTIINLQGFNISTDLHKIAKELTKLPISNSLLKTVFIDSKPYYLFAYNEPLVDKKLGKVLGKIWGVQILNHNQFFINRLKKDLNLQGLLFLDRDDQVISSTLNENQVANFTPKIQNDHIEVSLDKKFIFTKKSIESIFTNIKLFCFCIKDINRFIFYYQHLVFLFYKNKVYLKTFKDTGIY